jgi:hypothetical protein
LFSEQVLPFCCLLTRVSPLFAPLMARFRELASTVRLTSLRMGAVQQLFAARTRFSSRLASMTRRIRLSMHGLLVFAKRARPGPTSCDSRLSTSTRPDPTYSPMQRCAVTVCLRTRLCCNGTVDVTTTPLLLAKFYFSPEELTGHGLDKGVKDFRTRAFGSA